MGMDDAELRAHFAETDERFERMMTLMASQFEAMQAHFDKRFDALEGRMGALEGRMDALDKRVDAMNRKFEEKFIGVYERLDSERKAREQFERRVMGRLDAMGRHIAAVRKDVAHLDARVTGLEKRMDGVDARLDGLSEDMRQQFRVVNERLAGLAA